MSALWKASFFSNLSGTWQHTSRVFCASYSTQRVPDVLQATPSSRHLHSSTQRLGNSESTSSGLRKGAELIDGELEKAPDDTRADLLDNEPVDVTMKHAEEVILKTAKTGKLNIEDRWHQAWHPGLRSQSLRTFTSSTRQKSDFVKASTEGRSHVTREKGDEVLNLKEREGGESEERESEEWETGPAPAPGPAESAELASEPTPAHSAAPAPSGPVQGASEFLEVRKVREDGATWVWWRQRRKGFQDHMGVYRGLD
eukprot:jgi/Mesen1/6045/ME000308S05240